MTSVNAPSPSDPRIVQRALEALDLADGRRRDSMANPASASASWWTRKSTRRLSLRTAVEAIPIALAAPIATPRSLPIASARGVWASVEAHWNLQIPRGANRTRGAQKTKALALTLLSQGLPLPSVSSRVRVFWPAIEREHSGALHPIVALTAVVEQR